MILCASSALCRWRMIPINASWVILTMQVKEKAAEGLRREYQVTADAATLKAHKEAKLKQLGLKVKLPGFRPGKSPAKILEQRYGNSVQGELLEDAVNKSSQQVIREK